MRDGQRQFLTRLRARDAERFQALAAAFQTTTYDLLRRCALSAIEAWEGESDAAPIATAVVTPDGETPAPMREREQVFAAVHALGMQRAALLRQLAADAEEVAATDPATGRTFRAVIGQLAGAKYQWNAVTGRWDMVLPSGGMVTSSRGAWHPDMLTLAPQET